MIMRNFALAMSLAMTLAASPLLAKPSAETVKQVQMRAEAAGFDGAILIGESDGSYSVITTGKQAVSPKAIWRWASITKQLTAVLAMQEVANGHLDLDSPISRYWPEWKAKHAASIRIRDLLLHNSGLAQPDESVPDKDEVPAFYRYIPEGVAEICIAQCVDHGEQRRQLRQELPHRSILLGGYVELGDLRLPDY